MTTAQAAKIARRKLSLLELVQELGNVSKACRIVGYSRQQFYEIRRNFQVYGAEGLLDRMPGREGRTRTEWPRRWRRRSWPMRWRTRRTARSGWPVRPPVPAPPEDDGTLQARMPNPS